MVGWPRVVGVKPMPSRAALKAKTRAEARQIEPWLTNDDFRRFKWWRQAEQEFQPFHQRTFFSAHPDLSFTNLNGDQPLKTSPHHPEGLLERVKLIREKLPGIEDIIMRPPPPGSGQLHLLQGCALLWTARRCAGRGMTRLPADPTWDDCGMRMELVR
jgi:predicted RNase H-like nuclease